MSTDITSIIEFLNCETPQAWLDWAGENTELLLLDHAHCEKKAAMGGLRLINEYAEKAELVDKMSRLVREEMRHFEQVLQLLKQRQIKFRNLSASRYAKSLQAAVQIYDPLRLIDKLIVGAFIEARSCERFHALIPQSDEQIGNFFRHLLKSESRHFMDYIYLARKYSAHDIGRRIDEFRQLENNLITSVDQLFRFHGGVRSLQF